MQFVRTISFVALVGVASVLHAQQPAPMAGTYPELYKQLAGLAADRTQVAPVSNLMLRRDGAVFHLQSGTAYLCTQVAGRHRAAVFVGRGTCTLVPPTPAERAQLKRATGSDTAVLPVAKLLVLFADSTADELRQALRFGSGAVDPGCERLVSDALSFVLDEDAKSMDAQMANAFLNDERSPMFYAHIVDEGGGQSFFSINPYVDSYVSEEVNFMRVARTRITPFRETVCQWGLVRPGGAQREHLAERLDMQKLRVECAIGEDLGITAAAEVTAQMKRPDTKWFDLYLYPGLRVDSILWRNGTRAEFCQTGGELLWVRNNPAAFISGEGGFTVYYRGTLFKRFEDWVVMNSSNDWFPHHPLRARAVYDLTFHYPENFKLAGVGKRVSLEEKDDIVTSRWVTDRPVRSASFGLGLFREKTLEPDSIAPITVYRGPHSSGGVSEQIAWDVENSIRFYQYLYGRLPFQEFHAAEIPEAHGEAFAGLIHLSASTFDRNDQSGSHEVFRSHEVAHQWWGIGVGYRSYRDQWLSEGFSEYSGLMFMQAVVKDNDKFFKQLRRYREAILTLRGSGTGTAGPISLGYRNSTSSNADGYFVTVYQKGAWVLHMLRNMMLDLQTMKEDRYRSAMREFFQTYVGSDATTQDFQSIVEKHAGMPMDWFFRQWVHGTDVPHYAWAYKTEPTGDGKYRLQLRVNQKNVPAEFRMYVPVKVDFGQGRIARLRVLVEGAQCEPQLPLMPLEPKSVVFNDLESVLCEVEEVDWD